MSAGRELNIGGKVFLLGEYAVLCGAPAVVAAVGPRFSLRQAVGSDGIDPASPAGRLVSAERRAGWRFFDPHEGRGGFGASTAQFALAYAQFVADADALFSAPTSESTSSLTELYTAAWVAYRELHADQAIPPSGADLVAQIVGGVVSVELGLGRPRRPDVAAERLPSVLPWGRVLLFTATDVPGRKTATYLHLQSLAARSAGAAQLAKLAQASRPALERGVFAIRHGDLNEFAGAVRECAQRIADAGFEAPSAREDREAFARMPGVAAVKGVGARLTDGLLIVLESDVPAVAVDAVMQAAASRRLRRIVHGGFEEPGLRRAKTHSGGEKDRS